MCASFVLDLRVAARRLLARRGATLVAIVTLSVGIGAVSSMYVLFRAATDNLPHLPHIRRIARVFIDNAGQPEGRIPPSAAEWQSWMAAPPPGIALAVLDDADVMRT